MSGRSFLVRAGSTVFVTDPRTGMLSTAPRVSVSKEDGGEAIAPTRATLPNGPLTPGGLPSRSRVSPAAAPSSSSSTGSHLWIG